MKTIDASKARKTFARVLEMVRERNESMIIVRYGRPIAALVPLDQLPSSARKLLNGQRRSREGGRARSPRTSRR